VQQQPAYRQAYGHTWERVPYLSASAVAIHYEEALCQVFAPFYGRTVGRSAVELQSVRSRIVVVTVHSARSDSTQLSWVESYRELRTGLELQRATRADELTNQRRTNYTSGNGRILFTDYYESSQIGPTTSCRRAAATICPRPSPPPEGAEGPRAAEQTATKQQFLTANTFPRPPLQLPDAPTRRWVKRPGDLWPWKWCPSHVWRGLPLCQFWSS